MNTLRKELESFQEFNVPFILAPETMRVIANYGIPDHLIPIMRKTLVDGFASVNDLSEVAR